MWSAPRYTVRRASTFTRIGATTAAIHRPAITLRRLAAITHRHRHRAITTRRAMTNAITAAMIAIAVTTVRRRGQALPQHSRLHATAAAGPAISDERLFDIVDVLDAIADETGRSVPQIAINWLLQRPTVSTVLIGARDEAQLRQNLGAVGWSLTDAQRARLDAVSAVEPPYPYYPYWRGHFAERSPLPV